MDWILALAIVTFLLLIAFLLWNRSSVKRHQESGGKAQGIGGINDPMSGTTEGMRDPEGDALLAELAGHMLGCPQYHHRWTFDDMVLWDNWRMLHSISPAPIDEPRVMQRTTIAGDYALGRRLEAEMTA